MAKPLDVLYLSSEVEPFAKTGGLADVAGALPQTIKHLDQEIRVMMPRYGNINERRSHLHEMIRLKDVEVPVDGRHYMASVKSSFLSTNHAKVQIYFLDNAILFGRSGLYVHPETKKEYSDNDERFIFFQRGVLEVLKRMGWQPDIIHCNDWQTGLIPAYLKTLYKNDPFYKSTKTVFTIHNMAYQGVFPASSFTKTLLPHEVMTMHGIEAWGNMNMLKSGLVFADAITTVSERYAEEIRTSSDYGCGLEHVVNMRRADLTGILNGIDYTIWNPAVDQHIPHRYDFKTIDLKFENKKALQTELDLPVNAEIPLVGIVSRLADQKGFDLIGAAFDAMMSMNIQFVLLGTGERRYHELFERAKRKYPTRVGVDFSFNDRLAHLIEAGSDIFLMPSRYEPCGLNQMYSLKYGTVPVVRATGGLDDTVEEFDPVSGRGTGCKFRNYDPQDMLNALRRALQYYADQATWRKIIKNGMSKDFSWEISAKKYIQLYRSLSKK
jgi:starch synthase